MIELLYKNYPIGKNYLICQKDKEQINSYLMKQLVVPFQTGRKHNLWGDLAKKLPQIGKQLGWVPNKLPAIFLTPTVENEIADALAAANNYLQPIPDHFKLARELLNRLGLVHLAARNPLFLSEGETKMIWFLTQWVKQPIYFIVGYLPAGLSKQKIRDITDFLESEQHNSKSSPVIILGFLPGQVDWCDHLFSSEKWQTALSL